MGLPMAHLMCFRAVSWTFRTSRLRVSVALPCCLLTQRSTFRNVTTTAAMWVSENNIRQQLVANCKMCFYFDGIVPSGNIDRPDWIFYEDGRVSTVVKFFHRVSPPFSRSILRVVIQNKVHCDCVGYASNISSTIRKSTTFGRWLYLHHQVIRKNWNDTGHF